MTCGGSCVLLKDVELLLNDFVFRKREDVVREVSSLNVDHDRKNGRVKHTVIHPFL